MSPLATALFSEYWLLPHDFDHGILKPSSTESLQAPWRVPLLILPLELGALREPRLRASALSSIFLRLCIEVKVQSNQ
jgi:hypothetical protein